MFHKLAVPSAEVSEARSKSSRSDVAAGNSDSANDSVSERSKKQEHSEVPRENYMTQMVPSQAVVMPPASCDLLIDCNTNDKDITMHLDIDVAIDIQRDLTILARLNRLGHFNTAIKLFNERLVPHVDFFPVVAEYADLLLEQGNFGQLQQFLGRHLHSSQNKFSYEEYLLIRLLKSFAEAHTKGALLPALNTTLETRTYFLCERRTIDSWLGTPSGVEIALIEVCLRILAYVAEHSIFLKNTVYSPLLRWLFPDNPGKENHGTQRKVSFPDKQADNTDFHRRSFDESLDTKERLNNNMPQASLPHIGDFFRVLVEAGFIWESHRILKAVLPLLSFANSGFHDTYGGFKRFARIEDLSEAIDTFIYHEGDYTENEQIFLTNMANSLLLASFFATNSGDRTVSNVQRQFHDKACYLTSLIPSMHPSLIGSRTNLNGLLIQGVSESETTSELKSTARGSIPYKLPYSHLDRVLILNHNSESIQQYLMQLQVIYGTRTKFPPQGTLDTILAAAKETGDYMLERCVLQKAYLICQDFRQKLQLLQSAGQISCKTMGDSASYLQSLVDEYLFLEANVPREENWFHNDLSRRLSNFEHSYPCRFKQDPSILEDTTILLFDNPLLTWMGERVRYLLSRAMRRELPAALIHKQLLHIQRHLPDHILFSLNSHICTGCQHCGLEKQPESMRVNEEFRQVSPGKPVKSTKAERIIVMEKFPVQPAGLRNGKPVRFVPRLTEKETLDKEQQFVRSSIDKGKSINLKASVADE